MGDQIVGILSPLLRRKRFEASLPFVEGRVLDYGCGVGLFSQFCDRDNYLGIDTDIESIEIAKKRYPNYCFSTKVSHLLQFDTIICLAVIEHLDDPVDLLVYFKSLLSPFGRIVITTPHPFTRNIHELGSRVGIFSPDADEHKDLINYSTMNKIAAQANLKIDKYSRFLFYANQLFVLSNDQKDGDE